MGVFDDTWQQLLQQRNKRDRIDLGTVSMDGLTAYPVEMTGDGGLREMRGGFDTGRPHNIEGFRNIDINAPHISPGIIQSTGEIRPDTGVLSILTGGQKIMGIANMLPLREPFFRLNENKQADAYLGRKKPDSTRGNANRTAHLWAAGNLLESELKDLYAGRSPLDILDMHSDLQLGRNPAGDAALSFAGGEAPRFGYKVYDILDNTLGPKEKWKQKQRLPLRQDFGQPWRPPRSHGVSGSVDPLLQIPLSWTDIAPDREGQMYVEYTEPGGYRQEGIPVPLSLTAGNDYSVPALTRGIATGTHGMYFDPNDLTSAGLELWDAAMTGDIIRRSWEVMLSGTP